MNRNNSVVAIYLSQRLPRGLSKNHSNPVSI